MTIHQAVYIGFPCVEELADRCRKAGSSRVYVLPMTHPYGSGSMPGLATHEHRVCVTALVEDGVGYCLVATGYHDEIGGKPTDPKQAKQQRYINRRAAYLVAKWLKAHAGLNAVPGAISMPTDLRLFGGQAGFLDFGKKGTVRMVIRDDDLGPADPVDDIDVEDDPTSRYWTDLGGDQGPE